MLNISKVSVSKYINTKKYSAFEKLQNRSISNWLIKLLIGLSLIGVCALFLPWTQNIRSKGYVTTLKPQDRPQAIQSLISGRIESWKVKEGDIVNMGDTILIISESKENYLDPQLLERTNDQIIAKSASSDAYNQKAILLDEQYKTIEKNKLIKLDQNKIKIKQSLLKIQSDSIELEASKIKLKNAENQKNRIEELYKKGIKTLTDFENKNLIFQESIAKVNYLENKIRENKNDIENLKNNASVIANDFDQKLAKLKADKMSTLSMKFGADAETSKLKTQYSNYDIRNDAYVVKSPISGMISLAVKNGIGEYIKAGENIVTITPNKIQKAVETFIRPQDMPLLEMGQKVRIQFDGWPSIVFSGWPQNSFGTFGGKIVSIDNQISNENEGFYRILISEDESEEKWPEEVRIGGGANCLTLLKNVKLYYEIWRQLNGFPPDYYKKNIKKDPKTKAPIKKIK